MLQDDINLGKQLFALCFLLFVIVILIATKTI